MKFSEKIKLAFYNLTHRKKTTAQCVAMISFIMLLIFISAFFISTLVLQLNENLDKYASRNYIEIEHTGSWVGEEFIGYDNILLDEKMRNDLKAKFNSVGDINYYRYLSFFYNPFLCDWVIDGEIYKNILNENDESYWSSDEDYFNYWRIVSKELNVPTFSENMKLEFSKKFPDQKLIKYGRDIENDNEVLLPEEYLSFFNITPEQLLNAESVTIEDVFSDVKVVGIINANVNMLYPGEDGNRDQWQDIYIYTGPGVSFIFNLPSYIAEPDDPSYDLTIQYAIRTFQRIELISSKNVREVINYLNEILNDPDAEYLDYRIDFGNQAKLNELDAVNDILIFVREIILILFLVLGVGFVVFLYSVMEHNAKQKGAYWGMMRAMGEKSTLSITIIETIIITLIASIICLIISAVAVSLLSGTIISISWSSYQFTLNKGLFAIVFVIILAVEILLNILIAFLSSRRQNSKRITAALRS